MLPVVRPKEVKAPGELVQRLPGLRINNPINAVRVTAHHDAKTVVINPFQQVEVRLFRGKPTQRLPIGRDHSDQHRRLKSIRDGLPIRNCIGNFVAGLRYRNRVAGAGIVGYSPRASAGLHPDFVLFNPDFVVRWRINVGRNQREHYQ